MESNIRYQGKFEDDLDPALTVDLLVIERAEDATKGPWRASGALVRKPGSAASWVEGWRDLTCDGDADPLFDYFVDRGGGNAYTLEIAFVRIASVRDAPAVVEIVDTILGREGRPLM